MALQGVGANGSNDYHLQKNDNLTPSDQEVSVWAKFKDDNNRVDISDVEYIANNNELRSSSEITSFLKSHIGETWTTALKNELNNLINRFNLECEGDLLSGELDDPKASFNKFKEGITGSFKSFVSKNQLGNSNAEFDKFKKDINEDFRSFIEDENGKMIDFTAKNRQDKDEFVRESVNKVLEDLRNGYEGFVSLSGIGVINYDSKENCFVLKRDNGQVVNLDDVKLTKILDIAIEHSLGINGRSKKLTTG